MPSRNAGRSRCSSARMPARSSRRSAGSRRRDSPKSTNNRRGCCAAPGSSTTNRFPGWGSAWNSPSDEHLRAVGAREDREHRARLDAEPREPGAVVDRDRGVVAHREHAARRVRRDHLGHQHRRRRRRGSRRSRRRRAPRARSRALRAARRRTRGTARRRRRCARRALPQPSSQRAIRRSAASDAASHGYCTFTTTGSPPGSARAVRLRDRRGAERLARRTRRTRARAGCRARSPPRRGSARTAAAARGRAALRARR